MVQTVVNEFEGQPHPEAKNDAKEGKDFDFEEHE